jgi:beta-fructofuranosidase
MSPRLLAPLFVALLTASFSHSEVAKTSVSANEVHAGPFHRIYQPPNRAGTPWYLNDHCFIQGPDGRWHVFGITQAEPAKPMQERFLAHASADNLLASTWRTEPDVLAVQPPETVIWAPHIVAHEGIYYLFYSAGGEGHRFHLHLATSRDLFHWERHPANPLLIDGYDARDPMVLQVGGEWILYYTATSAPEGGNHIVAAVTSRDLVHWSNRRVVFTHPRTGTYGGPTESPYVVKHGGRYYLFLCENPPYNSTAVYVSADPLAWSIDALVGHVPAHAAEVIAGPDGRWWVSRAGWGRGGLYLAELYWPDGRSQETGVRR